MGFIKLSQLELRTQACQQIFTMESKIKKTEFSLEEIGDLVPGNVMVQDISSLTNIYMNKSGCKELGYEREEIAALGPEYFTRFFPEDEMKNILLPNLINFVARQDTSEVYSFFQRVRGNENKPYKWYFTTTKFYQPETRGPLNKVITIATQIDNLGEVSGKMNRILEENEFMKKNFYKFSLLTKREKEIITLLVSGKNSPEIADILFVSRFTVNTHRRNIAEKLEIRNFAELLKFALAFDLA